MAKLFDVPDNTEIVVTTNKFECFACGRHAKRIVIKGWTTNIYEFIKDEKRRKIIEVKKYGPACNCHDQILIRNTEVEDEKPTYLGSSGTVSVLPMQLSSLGIPQFYLGSSGTAAHIPPYVEPVFPPYVEPVKERPFFLTVTLSDKGERAGLIEKEDGIYTKFGTKLIDREMLVR